MSMLDKVAGLEARSVVGGLLRLPLKLIPGGHVTTVRHGVNEGRKWVVGSSIHGCWLGTYEPEKQKAVGQIARPGMTVWDVGANAGFYMLAFSGLVGDSGKVYAFEPSPDNIPNLVRHHRLNELGNTRIVQAALADRTGLQGFAFASSNAEGHLSDEENAYLVPTYAADDFLARFPDARPDLVKLDIEGGESAFLEGAKLLLGETGPDVLIALHGEVQTQKSLARLASHGYSLFYLDGSPVDAGDVRSDELYARKA